MTREHRVLVVGGGSIGERHVRCFAATGRAEVALCEVQPAVRDTVAKRYDLRHAYEHYDAALEAGANVVVIATPAHLHIPMATSAAKAGRHVLVEKPLSTSFAGVDDLMRLAEQQRVTAGVAYVYRCHPALAGMRAALMAGRFGTAVELVATCGQHFPFYRPAYRDIYYNNRATGGGAVQDALTHVMNAAQWLVGPADRLVADFAHQVLEGVEVEDTVHVLARHGRVLASYSLNQHQVPNEMTLSIHCTAGTARFEYHRNRWRWMSEPGGAWTDEVCGPLERDTLFIRQAEFFLDAIDGKSPPLCTLAEARHTLDINLAILRSRERDAWEALEPAGPAHG